MSRAFILIFIALSLNPRAYSQQTMNTSKQVSYLALGDSYTIGEAVEHDQRFPFQLTFSLRKRNIDIADPIIIALTGWTTDELSVAIDNANPQSTFSFVTLLIGVNNQYRGRGIEEYRREFMMLLQRAIGFAGGNASHVVVVSIPDWGVMPFAEGRDRKQIAKEIDAFNAVNWEESVRLGALYVDITPISREAVRYPELIASDELHPSVIQYKYWVALIEPKVLKILEVETEKEKK
jgi:hypothetical protein